MKWGYNLSNIDTSLGLADDTAILANTPKGITRAWNVLREIFDLHGWKLNVKKTQARYNQSALSLVSGLQGLADWGSGEDRVIWKGWNQPFRYLGVWIRLDLDSESHFEEIEKDKLNIYL